MRVVFDIGHGSNSFTEKGEKGIKFSTGEVFEEHDFNCAVAEEAKRLAEYNGFEVIYTQQPHTKCIPLTPRIDFVNAEHKKNPIECLISFHANASATNPNASGWSVFHWHTSSKGKKLAEAWAKYAKEMLPIKQWDTGVWQCKPNSWTNFWIVAKPVMPCILIEHFFFTNYKEYKICNTEDFIKKSAEVAVKALCEYTGITYKEEVKTVYSKKLIYPYTTLLKKGSKGEQVKILQSELNRVGYNCGAVDGDFGTKTDIAVRNYQSALKLKIDGIVGLNTWNALFSVDIIEVDPMNLKAQLVKASGQTLAKTVKNFINSNFFSGSSTIGWLISDGKILSERHEYKTWKGNVKGTSLILKDGSVIVKQMLDSEIVALKDKIKFACQGFYLPKDGDVNRSISSEGYNSLEVARRTERVGIGHNGDKIIIAYQKMSDGERIRNVMNQLGCAGNSIGLDGGGSTNVVVDGKAIITQSRVLTNIITF